MQNEEALSDVLERVAAFLGFKTDGSYAGTARAFAHWLAFAEAFVANPDGQHQATWTEVMLRVIGMRGMMAARSEASEAADVADAALRELVKRFPPRMVTYDKVSSGKVVDASWPSDDELTRAEDIEVSAVELMSEQILEWQKATTCEAPQIAEEVYATQERSLEKARVELAEMSASLATTQNDRDLWRANFLDAELLIHNIREALGIPKEGHADVLAVAKTAIVPKPKPKKIEVGQRWAAIGNVTQRSASGGTVSFDNILMGAVHGQTNERTVLTDDSMVYLGKS